MSKRHNILGHDCEDEHRDVSLEADLVQYLVDHNIIYANGDVDDAFIYYNITGGTSWETDFDSVMRQIGAVVWNDEGRTVMANYFTKIDKDNNYRLSLIGGDIYRVSKPVVDQLSTLGWIFLCEDCTASSEDHVVSYWHTYEQNEQEVINWVAARGWNKFPMWLSDKYDELYTLWQEGKLKHYPGDSDDDSAISIQSRETLPGLTQEGSDDLLDLLDFVDNKEL